MKIAAIIGCAVLFLVGCSSYRGGVGNESDTSYGSGTAAEMPDASGWSRAKGTNEFNSLPPLPADNNATPGSNAP